MPLLPRLRLPLSLIALNLLALLASFGYAADIVVLKSSDVAYYSQAVQGFRTILSADIRIIEHTLSSSATNAREIGQSIRAEHPNLVLAVGLKAALTAKLEIPDIPVIFCQVLNPELHGLPTPNMTGVLMKVPPRKQLEVIKTLAPRARRIGVLFDSTHNASLIAAAIEQARDSGLQLITTSVSAKDKVGGALYALLPQVDLLWVIPDQTVVTEEFLPLVLDATFDARIPLFVFSSTLVQRGALGALVVDPAEAGQQAGRVATTLLRDPSSVRGKLIDPEHPKLVLNLNAAEHAGLAPTSEIVRSAALIYGGPGPFASDRPHVNPAP